MELIFVYNASLDPTSLAKDFIAEILPQKEANCTLCDITYSLVFKKRKWKEYLTSLGMESSFYLKDQFQKKFPLTNQAKYPCVFLKRDQALELIISAAEINTLSNLEELIKMVEEKKPKI